jgi:hypothetical protein
MAVEWNTEIPSAGLIRRAKEKGNRHRCHRTGEEPKTAMSFHDGNYPSAGLQSCDDMGWSRFLLVAALLAPAIAKETARVPATVTYHFRPDRARRALELSVKPGDLLSVEGGGCLPFTELPPARVIRPFSDAEQTLIFIPGVTMSFVPVSDLIGRQLFVPASLDYPGEPRVWLDWGRYYHGPLERPEGVAGRPMPCEGVAEAPHVDIAVRAGSSGTDPEAAGTLTLESRRYDLNRLPWNPRWAGGGSPDVCGRCEGFRIDERPDGASWIPALQSKMCTRERPYVDAGGCEPRFGDCPGFVRRLAAHVDWGPATFTGLLSTQNGGPVHVALDGDVELLLRPDGDAALVASAPGEKYHRVIGVEFSSPETNRWFRTSWWRKFPFRSANYRAFAAFVSRLRRHPGAPSALPAFRDLPTTAIGIFNIDTAHNHPEIHPVQAIAIQSEASADRAIYQVFARNWGTGGDCGGRLDHALDLPRVVLALKGAEGGGWVAADGEFYDHGLPFSDWRVYSGTVAPALVIELPRQRRCGVVEGTLTLRRGAAASPPAEGGHIFPGDPPIGEPVRLSVAPGPEQLCVDAEWFLPVN